MTEHPSELLLQYATGDLESTSLGHVESHLTYCEACRGEVTTLRRMHDLLSALPAPAPSARFERRLSARLAIGTSHTSPAPWRRLAAVAALVLVTVASTIGVMRAIPPLPSPTSPRLGEAERRYMLIFYEDVKWRGSLPVEVRKARTDSFAAWVRDLQRASILVPGGQRLRDEAGRVVLTGGSVIDRAGEVPDDELMTGYLLIRARDYREASGLSMGCPIVTFGRGRVAIREVW